MGNLVELGSIRKNPSPTSAKNKAKLEYLSEGQPSPLELVFAVELDPNPYSKMISKHIQEVLGMRECNRKNLSLTSAKNKSKLKYISEEHPLS